MYEICGMVAVVVRRGCLIAALVCNRRWGQQGGRAVGCGGEPGGDCERGPRNLWGSGQRTRFQRAGTGCGMDPDLPLAIRLARPPTPCYRSITGSCRNAWRAGDHAIRVSPARRGGARTVKAWGRAEVRLAHRAQECVRMRTRASDALRFLRHNVCRLPDASAGGASTWDRAGGGSLRGEAGCGRRGVGARNRAFVGLGAADLDARPRADGARRGAR